MDGARKLLVTGAGGFVAGSVIAAALNEHEIHAVSRGNPILCHPNLKWYTLDLLDTSSVAELFKQTDPHAVVHTAALANIDVCEKDPALARRINVEMTALVAEMSAKHGARLVYCSTDNVFDGRHAPYTENDEPCPVNVYGQTKSEAERLVMNVSRGAVVARLAFVVGLPLFGNGESFLTRVIRAIVSGEKLCAPHDEYRTPIDVV
ncbi:MAG: sugar nucleotide-binding protein, partial [Verrucomicrobiae bacterium]|nr:sugar nucleotide-binding protein [Verrucomicrobiae bacterium]